MTGVATEEARRPRIVGIAAGIRPIASIAMRSPLTGIEGSPWVSRATAGRAAFTKRGGGRILSAWLC